MRDLITPSREPDRLQRNWGEGCFQVIFFTHPAPEHTQKCQMRLCCAGSRNERVAIDETGVRVCTQAISVPLFRPPRTPNILRASSMRAGGPGQSQHQHRLRWREGVQESGRSLLRQVARFGYAELTRVQN